MKAQLAALHPFDAERAPFNTPLIAWLGARRAEGVRIVLATAADFSVAEAAAAHAGVFDEVIASDGARNLKGEAKAAALVERFGERGFIYIGDSAADIPVWKRAAGGVAISPGRSVVAKLGGLGAPVAAVQPLRSFGHARLLLKAMRPHQWSKNLLAFIPIATSGAYLEGAAWLGGILAFLAFSLTASGVYLVNDALDIPADRRHPRKRERPFASGALPARYVAAAGPLFLGGLGVAALAGVFWIVLAYVVMTSWYSVRGKRLPILDVALLSLLYSIRLYAGGEATGHEVTVWLLAFSGFLFFNLAIMKRYAELRGVKDSERAGRGYDSQDLALLLSAGVSSGFAAAVVMALYVENSLTTGSYSRPYTLWALAPLMLVWQLRLWRETLQGRMTDDPIVYAARDRATWLIVALSGACLVYAQAASA